MQRHHIVCVKRTSEEGSYAENLEKVLEREAHVDKLSSALTPELCLR